jgi:hypothetical protein
MSSASVSRKGSAPAIAPATAIATDSVAIAPATATAPDLFGFPVEGSPSFYTSPKFSGTVTLSPRANYLFFALALCVGVRGDVIAYANPNRVGRGGCIEYASRNFGKVEFVEGYYRISDVSYRTELLAVVTNRLGGESGVAATLARIATDYTECSPNRKGNRIGTLP